MLPACCLPLPAQSEAISKCDHHCASLYREMTKQLLPHCCRHRGSPCLGAAPSPSSTAGGSALAAQPSWDRCGDPGDAGDVEMPEMRGWSRAVRCGAERGGKGGVSWHSAANGAVKYSQSLPCMLMCPGGDGGGKAPHELQGSIPELPVCPSWPPVRRGQGRSDSFWTRNRAVPPAPQTCTQHLGQGGRLHSGAKRNRSDLNRSCPTFFLPITFPFPPVPLLWLAPLPGSSYQSCLHLSIPLFKLDSETSASLIYPFAVESPLSQ